MISDKKFISICIPAYKRVVYLERLLESISNQSYIHFEVIITDDSGNNSPIEKYLYSKNYSFSISYYNNVVSLGSPKNWIEAISNAKGDWIKIMHDDDYFASKTSLQEFVDQIEPGVDCIFSGYNAVFDNGKSKDMSISIRKFMHIVNKPLLLFSGNIIGPPSVMMFRSIIRDTFDHRLKWIVDWEYYIRLSLKYNLKYIPRPLISVSYNDTQITNNCFLNPAVEVPETLIFTNKYGNILFKNIFAYDAWWRLLRNLGFRDVNDLKRYSNKLYINENIYKMLSFQTKFSLKILKVGLISKLLMTVSYIFNRVQ